MTGAETLQKLRTTQPPAQFDSFHAAYIVLTEQLLAARYQNPEIVDRLIAGFGDRYFAALQDDHGSWRRLAASHSPFPSWRLMLGAYAHIHEDLLPTLQEFISDPAAIERDYLAMDNIIMKSGHAILAAYRQADWLHQLAAWPALWLVVRWRHRVWRVFVTARLHEIS